MSKRILIIRLSALGDVIFTLPVLAAVRDRFPGATVDWLVEDKAASILLHRNDLGRVVVYPRREISACLWNPIRWPRLAAVLRQHLALLRAYRYDVIYDLHGNLKSGLHTLVARGTCKVGFARGHTKEGSHRFTSEQIVPPGHASHRVERAVSLVQEPFDPEAIRRPDLMVPPELVTEARASVRELLGDASPMLAVHPGTSAFGAFKRWPAERFGALAARLRDEHGFSTLVLWGPGEQALAQAVSEAGGDRVCVCPPTRSLMHLAAYASLADAYVSSDSGPLHLANYLGVPCLGLFGPKDPETYRPYFPPSRTIRAGVPCSPCRRRTCPDPICMQQLSVDRVYDELLALLADARGRPD